MATVREAFYDVARSLQLTTIFGNPGSTEETLLRDFPADFRHVLALQEAPAVAMAHGYAQRTGRAALVNLHTAAGMGNALGSIESAWYNRAPPHYHRGTADAGDAAPRALPDQRPTARYRSALREMGLRVRHRLWFGPAGGFCVRSLGAFAASKGPITGVTLHDLADDFAVVIRTLGNARAVLFGRAFGHALSRMVATDHPDLGSGILAASQASKVPSEIEQTPFIAGDLGRPEAERNQASGISNSIGPASPRSDRPETCQTTR